MNSTGLPPGEYVATVSATQQSASVNMTGASQNILLVVTGDAKAQFTDVSVDSSGSADAAASLSLGFQPNQTAITINATLSTEGEHLPFLLLELPSLQHQLSVQHFPNPLRWSCQ